MHLSEVVTHPHIVPLIEYRVRVQTVFLVLPPFHELFNLRTVLFLKIAFPRNKGATGHVHAQSNLTFAAGALMGLPDPTQTGNTGAAVYFQPSDWKPMAPALNHTPLLATLLRAVYSCSSSGVRHQRVPNIAQRLQHLSVAEALNGFGVCCKPSAVPTVVTRVPTGCSQGHSCPQC